MTLFPSRETVKKVRKQYPTGTRVKLVKMDDPQAPPVYTKGTVKLVDDVASIHIVWDNGSALAAVYGEDIVEKVDYQLVMGYRDKAECVCIAYDYDALVTIALSMVPMVKDGKLHAESGSVIERLYIETFDEEKDDNVTVWEYSQESEEIHEN